MSKYRGVRLGTTTLGGSRTRFRVRSGRCVGYSLVEALDREWLNAYVAWFKSRGQHHDAANLRICWLASQKVRT